MSGMRTIELVTAAVISVPGPHLSQSIKKQSVSNKVTNPFLAECLGHKQDQYWTRKVIAAHCPEAPGARETECKASDTHGLLLEERGRGWGTEDQATRP